MVSNKPEPPEPLDLKHPGRPRDYNIFSYLKASERAWVAGVLDAAGHITPHKVVNTRKQGRLLTYRCKVRGGLRIEHTIKLLGQRLNIEPRDYSRGNANPRYELIIPHDKLDALMVLLKPSISHHTYNAYVKAKTDADMTQFKLLGMGWQVTEDGAQGEARQTYRGIDFMALDEYIEANPSDPHGIFKQIAWLGDQLISENVEE